MPPPEKQFIERRKADETPREAEFTTIHGSQGVTNPKACSIPAISIPVDA